MNLFFDCGATKCDCIVLDENGRYAQHCSDTGFNASYADDEAISAILNRFAQTANEHYKQIVFSGAGCGNPQNGQRVKNLLTKYFQADEVVVESDLAGACRLLCPGVPGIVAILGTGAAVCRYDGSSIAEQVPSLGWMLGDEGSGTHLGKKFIASYLKGELLPATATAYESEFAVDRAEVLRRIYRAPSPNLFFSEVTKFMNKHADSDPQIKIAIREAVDDFFQFQVTKITNYQQYTLNLMGSIGTYFLPYLEEGAAKYGIIIRRTASSPLHLFQQNR